MSVVEKLLEKTVEQLGDLARSDMVVGKAVEVKGKTIIPILKVSVGFAGAGATGEGGGFHKGKIKQKHGGKGQGTGLGTGGGVRLSPVAVVVKDAGGVRIVPLPQPKKGLDKLLDKIPSLIEKIQPIVEGSPKD